VTAPVGHPVVLHLAGEPVVVVGAGPVAERKVDALLESQARVTVIAPEATPGLQAHAARGAIRLVARGYQAGDLAGCRLAYVATDEAAVSRAVHAEASARGIWLNVADQPALCGFTAPAVVRQGDLVVAVSTGGASPALARLVRERLERELGPEYAAALTVLGRVRDRLREEGALGTPQAREALQALAGPALLHACRTRDGDLLEELLARALGPGWTPAGLGVADLAGNAGLAVDAALRLAPGRAASAGCVYLVGAGPGDPDLLTVKGRRCLETADVVVYDALVDKRLLEHARPGAILVHAGKREGHHSRPQEEINALLVQYGRAGLAVVRLKGGDPFMFGRGGEEGLALAEAGVPFEVVPGVTAGLAVPAYAGIPVTQRNVAATVTFVTGHERTGKDLSQVRWEALGADRGTLVFFMGLRNLDEIAARLHEHGRPPGTPVAVIEWGTTDRQVTVTGTLATIVERVRAAGLEPPALVVVGEVVALRDRLRWFPEPWGRPPGAIGEPAA
jgi:uroporphyrin-III C-methyltransferase/precorrin-2 dehydrogenase/sirohydrochlorin ferrochelatase